MKTNKVERYDLVEVLNKLIQLNITVERKEDRLYFFKNNEYILSNSYDGPVFTTNFTEVQPKEVINLIMAFVSIDYIYSI